jgi:hypothetical protein
MDLPKNEDRGDSEEGKLYRWRVIVVSYLLIELSSREGAREGEEMESVVLGERETREGKGESKAYLTVEGCSPSG